MSTKAATTEATEQASGNLTLAQLGQRMNKGRKASSAQATGQPAEAPAAPATRSEQADAEADESVLSQSATDDSTALESTAAAGEEDGEETTGETEGTEAETTEDDAEGDPEGEPDRAKQSKAVRDLRKQVNKKHAQLSAEREENARLRERLAQLEQAEKPATATAASHPADGLRDRTVSEIDTELAGIEGFLSWADENPEGGSFEDSGKTFQLTEADVKAYRKKSERERIRLAAKREARLETVRADFDARRAASHAEAVRLYPWIERKGSPEFQEAVAFIRENPEVLSKADFELIVARQVTQQRLEREAAKKLKTPARKTLGQTPTPVVAQAAATTPKRSVKAEEARAVESQFQESGRTSDLGKLLAQRRQARIAQAES